jgi:RNA polymerase II-associated protein 2
VAGDRGGARGYDVNPAMKATSFPWNFCGLTSTMASSKALKSILKNSDVPLSRPTKEDHDREIALYHAQLIQHRKDIELEILLSIERLIDLPLQSNFTAADPAPSDISLFKALLQPFQPSDYDCLIEERNINERCGYTLCSNRRFKDSGKGYRIIGKTGRAKDFKVVPKEELEKWCSENCAKRAMYVKVQLSERPAWERAGSTRLIELLDERKTEAEIREAQLAEDLRKLNLNSMQHQEDLALERGDRGVAAMSGIVEVSVREKEITGAAEAPSLDQNDLDGRFADMHLGLEGYIPKHGREA